MANQGINRSLWQDISLPRFPALEGDLQTDVLIVGGGLAGILCAKLLSDSGVSCALIERDRICSGVTANTTAKITSQHGLCYSEISRQFDTETAKAYYEANQLALQLYRQLSSEIPCDLETKDAYVYTTEDTAKLEQELTALEKIGAEYAFTKDTELPFPVSGAICFPNQAQFHPLKFVSGLVSSLPIYEDTTALAFKGNTVVTNRGRIQAEKIIVATHFPIVNNHGLYPLKMYQHRSYVLALENAEKLQGMYIGTSPTSFSFRPYGSQLLLGGGAHRTGKRGGGWRELEAFARNYYPQARIVKRWATQDCMTLDGIPYIGPYSKSTPNLYVVTGFNKWGMSSSMVAAMILRDEICGKENPYSAVFRPGRTMFRKQLALNALESAVNLLTPTAPRCPHLGCALKWNRAERTWDCPCHGSRFAADGDLLDGPANGDLRRKNKSRSE